MATRVTLRNITLSQAINLMHTMATGEPALDVTAFRLSAPRDAASETAWHVELTLAYLVYEPNTSTTLGSRVHP